MPGSLVDVPCLRPVEPGDEPFLRSVYASTRAAELEQVPWTAEQKALFCDSQFTAQDTHYRSHFTQAQYYVIEQRGIAIGRLYVDRSPVDINILDIALLPAYCGAGLGTFLLRQLMDEAAASGKKVSIYVEKFNPAMTLYQRLGFQEVADVGVYLSMQWLPGAAQPR